MIWEDSGDTVSDCVTETCGGRGYSSLGMKKLASLSTVVLVSMTLEDSHLARLISMTLDDPSLPNPQHPYEPSNLLPLPSMNKKRGKTLELQEEQRGSEGKGQMWGFRDQN